MKNYVTKNSNTIWNRKELFLAIFLLLSSNVLQFFPMVNLLRELWYVFLLVYSILYIFIKQIMDNIKLSAFEIYCLIVIILMSSISTVTSNLEFGQPLEYGILAQRSMTLFSAGLALIYWTRINIINQKNIERSILLLAWSCLITFLAMHLLIEPALYKNVYGFVRGGTVEPFQFTFKSVFITFGIIYYVVRGIRGEGIYNYILAIPLIYFIIFIDGGRSQFMSLCFILFLVSFRYLSLTKLIIWFPSALMVLIIIIYSVMHYKGDEVEYHYNNLMDAIEVVTTGQKTADASANARLVELKLAKPYIEKNIIFGNGMLSAQWGDGFFGKIGYFAPSDIGIFGLIFVYGIFGVFVFYIQYLYAFRFSKALTHLHKANQTSPSNFEVSVMYYIAFLFTDSLATGRVVFSGTVSFTFIGILYLLLIEVNKSTFLSEKAQE